MQINQVHARRTVRTPYVVQRDDVFTLREDRKYVWLQKLCLSVLQKLGAFHREDHIAFSTIRIDERKFMQNLLTQVKEINREFNLKPQTVLMGSEEYHRLMGDPDMNTMLRFSTEYHHGRMNDIGEPVRTIHGLEVKVIPWMQGILVIDK